ncbi:hypothetical protein ACVME8_000381 [Bradyrhizobium diazoefficiens]
MSRGRATSDPDLKRTFPMKSAGKIGAFIAVLVLAGATTNPGYAQDAEHGKTIFKACAACHATDHASRSGPGLGEIIGRKAGTVPGFSYSNAMKKSDCLGYEDPQCVSGIATAGGSRKQDALRRAEEPDGPDGPRRLSCYFEVTAGCARRQQDAIPSHAKQRYCRSMCAGVRASHEGAARVVWPGVRIAIGA